MRHDRTGPRLPHRVMLVALVAGVGCICTVVKKVRTPDLSGDGTLRLLDLPAHRGIRRTSATPDGRFVVFSTTGPAPIMYVTDDRLVPIRATEKALSHYAMSKTGATILFAASAGYWFRLVSLPDLRLEQELEPGPQEEDRFGSSVGSMRAWAWEKGWVHINRNGQVIRIEESPLRFGQSGKADIQGIRAVAVDDETGRLVLCSEDRAVVFDLDRMETVVRVGLDDRPDHSACARGGVAWIATRSGAVLQMDVRSGRITGRVRVADKARRAVTRVDLAVSGRYLAASASLLRRPYEYPTVLKVFRVERGKLTVVATARVVLESPVEDLTILEQRKVVVLASDFPAFAWHYGETERTTKSG